MIFSASVNGKVVGAAVNKITAMIPVSRCATWPARQLAGAVASVFAEPAVGPAVGRAC